MRLAFASIAVAILIAGSILAGALGLFQHKPLPPDVRNNIQARLAAPPVQTATVAPTFAYRQFSLTPRAAYDVTARVVSTHRYGWNLVDDFFRVSPEDLALAWGPAADPAVTERLRLWQEDRFFKFRFSGAPPIPMDQLLCSLANTHMIPASDDVDKALRHVGKGDIVHMTGLLVDIANPDRGVAHTSLTRTDTGPGACEILYATHIERYDSGEVIK